jgi:hypothetical protein
MGTKLVVCLLLAAALGCGDVKGNTPADAKKADAAPDTNTAPGVCKFDVDKFDTSCFFAP